MSAVGGVESLVDRMAAQVAAWDEAGDGRAVFLDCYAEMTRAVERAIGAGRFADPSWVALLLDRFAAYYFESVDGGVAGRPVPEPWVLAHAAAVGCDAAPMQLLLAGVSAHINFDLVLALVDVLNGEWASADEHRRAERRADYDEINQVIAETADLVQDRVLERRSPALALVDPVLGRVDERLAVHLLTRWRRRVWRHAEAVLAESDAAARVERVAMIERQCVRRARWILL